MAAKITNRITIDGRVIIGQDTTPVTPVANFTANVTSGSFPLEVTFTDTSTNSPTSWAWDFQNNGSTDSTVQNPVFTYTSAGTYSVKLIATNGAGSDTMIKTSYITVTVPEVQQTFTSTGTGNWIVPAGVTSVSILCVGAGGGGAWGNTLGGASGGGGALTYVNSVSVTPGETLSVSVGSGAPGTVVDGGPANGGPSFVKRSSTSLCYANGGESAVSTAGTKSPGLGGKLNGLSVGSGGAGGDGQSAFGSRGAGGGGAGGYSGSGGNGATNTAGSFGTIGVPATNGSGGGGAGGCMDTTPYCGGGAGGGVGLLGEGSSGTALGTGTGIGGAAGSAGSNGGTGANGSNGVPAAGGNGGLYGGGGASHYNSPGTGNGANGAVRIIWGSGMSYPSNAT